MRWASYCQDSRKSFVCVSITCTSRDEGHIAGLVRLGAFLDHANCDQKDQVLNGFEGQRNGQLGGVGTHGAQHTYPTPGMDITGVGGSPFPLWGRSITVCVTKKTSPSFISTGCHEASGQGNDKCKQFCLFF